jgi:hypothetical protein
MVYSKQEEERERRRGIGRRKGHVGAIEERFH